MALEQENKELQELLTAKELELSDAQAKIATKEQELTNVKEATAQELLEIQEKLAATKKELTNSKSAFTKAKNALNTAQEEQDRMAGEVYKQVQLVAEKDAEIAALKAKVDTVDTSNNSIEVLKEKAFKVMQQEQLGTAYVSIDGHVFKKENAAQNYKKTSKKTYMVATLVNGNEVSLTDHKPY